LLLTLSFDFLDHRDGLGKDSPGNSAAGCRAP
jgi:hypothetical protein